MFKSKVTWKESTVRRFFNIRLNLGLVAVLLIVFVVLPLQLLIVTRIQVPRNVEQQMLSTSKVRFWSENFLKVSLAGGEGDAATLGRMANFPGDKAPVPSDPLTTILVNITDATPIRAASGETQWTVKAAATVSPPGNNSLQRTYWEMIVMEYQGSFQALGKRQVNNTEAPFKVESWYTTGVSQTGALGQAVQNFMDAYYKQGNGGALGTYITGDFRSNVGDAQASPIANSPFSKIAIQTIKAGPSSNGAEGGTSAPNPGDKAEILVNARAEASNSTWTLIDVALIVKFSENKQWQVDKFDYPMHFGKVVPR